MNNLSIPSEGRIGFKRLESWSLLVCMALFLIGMWSVPLALFGPNRALIPGDLGDARFNNYILEHFYRYITGRTDVYWDAPFMYPWKNVVALSDNLLGSAPIYSVFRMLGFTREGAFQGWILVLFALNYWCCLLALRKWAGNTALAACAAYIFAFGIYNIGQVNNLQVLPRFMVPLAFLFFWNHLRSGAWKWLLLAILAVVYQFYCGMYIGFILVYALFFLFIGSLIAYRTPSYLGYFRNWRFMAGWGGVAAVGILLMLPMMLHYLAVPKDLGTRNFSDILASVPRPTSYFFTHPAALSWRSLSHIGVNAFPQWWSHFHFIGAVPWAAALAVPFLLFSKRVSTNDRRLLTAIGSALLISSVFCLNIAGFSLYKLVFMLPGFSVLRAVDRFVNVQVVFFLILFVAVLNVFSRNRKAAWALSLLLPVLVVQDNRWDVDKISRFDKFDSQRMVEATERRIAREHQSGSPFVAVAYEPPVPVIRDFQEGHLATIAMHLNAMFAGQDLGIPVVNAYTGGYPGNYISFFDHTDHQTLANWCAFNGISTDSIQEIVGLAVPIEGSDTVRFIAANGKYLCADQSRDNRLLANKDKADDWETFLRLHTTDGRVAFLASNGNFLCAQLEGDQHLAADCNDLGDYGLFTMVQLDSGMVAIKAFNGRYVVLDPGTQDLRATGRATGKEAALSLIKPPAAVTP
ncbi:MAG: hypothetical protein JST45_13775 [Bacteroidetes bacterium]|nr:hypothetical protein [Bacteroidota bacterium]